MKKRAKDMRVTDERVVGESNRVYRLCFYILCGAVVTDVIVKFNLWTFTGRDGGLLLYAGIEAAILLAVFYISTFWLAGKGIPVCAADLTGGRFPRGRYAAVSAVGGLIVSVGLWTIRFAAGTWEYTLWGAVLFCGMVYIATFLAAFAVLYATFFAAYKVAARSNRRIVEEERCD